MTNYNKLRNLRATTKALMSAIDNDACTQKINALLAEQCRAIANDYDVAMVEKNRLETDKNKLDKPARVAFLEDQAT